MNSTIYQLAENVLFQKVSEETVILEPETGQYYTLDTIGTFMVEHLQQDQTEEEVVASVLKHYQADKQQVAADLNELIVNMLKQGLLVKVNDVS